MTPIYLNRLGNQIFNPTRTPNLIASLVLKVKSVALLIVPLIALFFLYQIFSDPKAKEIPTYSPASFNKLKISSKEKYSIEFILKNLAEKGILQLATNSGEMNKHGDKIERVHPLRFISYVLSNNKFKDVYLKSILNNRFKKKSFMDGLTKSLKKVHQNNNIVPYLDDFMLSLSINPSKKEKLKKFINENNWHEFFYFVKDNSKRQRFLF